ncbi:NAD(P)-dependent oxidoreductase [Bifidobacterium tissieri]|uniref:D-2-hydroxyacid dehydrogenase family protein n=1 Tax=Bifidobacterium tissieri TaxID=1630162 RepID=A0A5M9ZUJ4_9BIFI|nr:NAD(P)-dependent oxidoreductase [Bifidobacterium tissieri]KAA8831129.1 D-2-hydroxyacid dehydrogenase family protein [Bifidobacterium tissieri]KAA8833216.1 D-2-hydroxyacid dehydrogenase family protein [Bifidobacterium tissieri]
MIIERNMEHTDLPLVVIPACFPSMAPYLERGLDAIATKARVRMHTDMTLDLDEIMVRLEHANVAMTTGIHFNNDMLDALAPTLRCITFGGTGVANFVDVNHAHDLDIMVCNAVHYGDNAVAEHTIALLFEITHKAGRLDVRTRAQGWPGSDITEIGGMTMGIVGFGGIGHRVAELAHGLGMKLIVWARHPDTETLDRLGAERADSIDDVFAKADVVSPHLALNDATRGIITARHLDMLHPGAIFLNTARAELVEQGALERRLNNGDIFAGLDVFDPEPLPDDAPLRDCPNTVLTPHVAWRSDKALAGIVDQNIRSVVAFLDGGSYNIV